MTALPRAMVAIVTPFDDRDHVDVTAHAHNVELLATQGCSGFVIAGSTGEGPYLEAGERAHLVAATRSIAPDTTVVCGVNAESVRQATRQIDEAAQAGADVALVCTPGTLVRNSNPAVERFFNHVADASPIPVLLYSVPKVTGYALPTQIVRTLAEHDTVIGMKDSGGDTTRLIDLAVNIDAGFTVFAGASRVLADSHRNGAFGAITASANYAFHLVAAACRGDRNAQRELQSITAIVERYGVAGTKAAAGAAGLIAGPPRAPLTAPDAAAVEAIAAAVATGQQHRER